MSQTTPTAFMSYAHEDDDDRTISELRAGLEREVRLQTGLRNFRIFQDRDQLEWGNLWKDTVDAAIDAAVFLIPVVTPNFLNSPECRRELYRFLGREQQLGRRNLVLPIYYIADRRLENPDFREQDNLAAALVAHQFADWREYRHCPLSQPEMRKTVADLATKISVALESFHFELAPTTNRSAPGVADATRMAGRCNSDYEEPDVRCDDGPNEPAQRTCVDGRVGANGRPGKMERYWGDAFERFLEASRRNRPGFHSNGDPATPIETAKESPAAKSPLYAEGTGPLDLLLTGVTASVGLPPDIDEARRLRQAVGVALCVHLPAHVLDEIVIKVEKEIIKVLEVTGGKILDDQARRIQSDVRNALILATEGMQRLATAAIAPVTGANGDDSGPGDSRGVRDILDQVLADVTRILGRQPTAELRVLQRQLTSDAVDLLLAARMIDQATTTLNQAKPRRYSDRYPALALRHQVVDISVNLIKDIIDHTNTREFRRLSDDDGIRSLRDILYAHAAAGRDIEICTALSGWFDALCIPCSPVGRLVTALNTALDDARRPDPEAAVGDYFRAGLREYLKVHDNAADRLVTALTTPIGLDPRIAEALGFRRALLAAFQIEWVDPTQQGRESGAADRPPSAGLAASAANKILEWRAGDGDDYKTAVRSQVGIVHRDARRALEAATTQLLDLRPTETHNEPGRRNQNVPTDEIRTILDNTFSAVLGGIPRAPIATAEAGRDAEPTHDQISRLVASAVAELHATTQVHRVDTALGRANPGYYSDQHLTLAFHQHAIDITIRLTRDTARILEVLSSEGTEDSRRTERGVVYELSRLTPAVFIEYAESDEPWAMWVAWQLQEAGYRPRLHAWHAAQSHDSRERVDAELRAAKYVVVILSPAYLVSGLAEGKLNAALLSMVGASTLLVPIRVEPCELPELLGEVSPVSLVGRSEADAREVLLTSLRAAAGGRGLPALPAHRSPSTGGETPPPYPAGPARPGRDSLSRDLLRIVDRIPETTRDVIKQLADLHGVLVNGSPPGVVNGLIYLNYVYKVITEAVLKALEDGSFEHPDFIAALNVEFTKRYFAAIGSWIRDPGQAPRSWAVLLDRAYNPKISAVQYAIAGVSAQVNFDLPFAIVSTFIRLDLAFDDEYRSDYRFINDIYHSMIPRFRDDLQNRFWNKVDRLLGDFDDRLDDFLFIAAREMAWSSARRIWQHRADTAEVSKLVKRLDRFTGMIGRGVLITHL